MGAQNATIIPRIPLFSDPDLQNEGVNIGAESADNVQSINNTAPLVARFRLSDADSNGVFDATNLETGACCADKCIEWLRQSECDELGGNWLGAGETCRASSGRGVCCTNNWSTCNGYKNQCECAALGGTYVHGTVTTCATGA